MHFPKPYDIPQDLVRGSHSPAFTEFLRQWFIDTRALVNGEADLTFLKDLSPQEVEIARQLLRRNLKLRYTHIIDGTAALCDVDAIPILKAMLSTEEDPSRRLTIAGALWRLSRDDSFVTTLHQMVASKNATLKQAHIDQVLWLRDGRSVDMLVDLLKDEDGFVRYQALLLLNRLEFGKSFLGAHELPRQASDYEKRRNDERLRQIMISNIATTIPRSKLPLS